MSVKKKSWEEFQKTGLLLIINQILHIFGWAIVFEWEDYGTEKQLVKSVYPARVNFRGFKEECVDKAYQDVQTYLENNIVELREDFKE